MKYILICLTIFLLAVSSYSFQTDNFSKVESISSDFVMEKQLSIAQKPLISKGHFYFKNSGFLYWSYDSPFVSGYLLEDSKVYSWKYIGSKKKVEDITKQTYAKRMVEFIYMFLSMDMEKISKVYNVQELENSLELYPKKNVKGNTLEKIKLSFDLENSVVTEVDIIDKSGDNTIIKFNNSLTNTDIPSNLRDILNEK
ncbi:LolA family protein [Candidatus Ruminimicrobiellum ovillum]|uniref:LolA family protein n=1 Tax=Candidatus Ruminimicrobiellum ovillum TaxID=1947927 RepID=UPI00355A9475